MAQTFVSNTYTSDTTVSIPSNAANVRIQIQSGVGGTGGRDAGQAGGRGGSGRYGDFTYIQNFVARTLTIRIGGNGNNGANDTNSQAINTNAGASFIARGGYGGHPGPNGSSGQGATGAGATGVFDSTLNNYVVIAGGGGGGGGASFPNASFVGQPGFAGESWYSTTSPVASFGGQGASQGNDGGGGGGGGGGATGGAGGYEGIDGNRGGGGGGGGGSSYNGSVVTLNANSTNFTSAFVSISYTLFTPQINSFSSNPNPQTSGSDGIPNYNTTLSWNTSDVTSVSINNSIGAVGQNGSSSITNLDQSTAGSNSPATRNYTLTACAGSTCVTQTITVEVFNDNTPNNYSISNVSNLEPSTLTTTSTTNITGIDMPTTVTAGPGVQVSTNNINWSSTTLVSSNGIVLARAVSPPFNTNPSGLTNSSQFYIDIGPVRRFFTLTTRAPDVNETFDYSNEDDRVPYPDIDTITTPPDNPAEPYISSNTLSVDDIEIPVEIKTNNSNVQIRVKRAGASSWENWQDARSI